MITSVKSRSKWMTGMDNRKRFGSFAASSVT